MTGDRQTLLAADCAQQYGADSQGPAEVQLTGTRLSVHYVEFQENDRCEVLDATIDLVTTHIERQDRQIGVVDQDRCTPEAGYEAIPPPGDGSLERPLLVLHRG